MNRVSQTFSQWKRREAADDSARQIEILQTVITPLLLAAGIFAAVAFLALPDGKQSTLIALTMAGVLALLTVRARPAGAVRSAVGVTDSTGEITSSALTTR